MPRPLLALAAFYFVASLAHFSHNAEFIAFYPGLPASITRSNIYVVWLAITAVGLGAVVLARLGRPALALVLFGVYGAIGLAGLAHYTLALCSEHTLVANLTIWSEATSGLLLLLASAVLFVRRLRPRGGDRTLSGVRG